MRNDIAVNTCIFYHQLASYAVKSDDIMFCNNKITGTTTVDKLHL